MSELCYATVEVDGKVITCDLPGTVRMAGEADSFGTEWWYFCTTCAPGVRAEWAAEAQAQADRLKVGKCKSCGKHCEDRRPTTVFNDNSWEDRLFACSTCIRRAYDNLDAELATV